MKLSASKLFVGISIMLAFSLTAKAEEIPVDLAQKIALKVASENFTNEISGIKALHFYPNLSQPSMFVMDISPSGFVIVSNEDNTYPVLGYSSRGHFNLDEMPPALAELIYSYDAQIEFIRENGLQASAKIENQWTYYSTTQLSPGTRAGVEPLVSTTWNQTRYYNVQCPVDSGVTPQMQYHVPAGCFAVAMAQVLKYYEHPSSGEGQHSYDLPDYGQIIANFEVPGYNYSNMPPGLEEDNEDVARLIYHCGVSLTTAYGTSASLAFVNDIKAAMIDHFRYQDDIKLIFRSQYADEEWIAAISNELDQNRPVIYRGTGANGGHGWLCDGYNNEDLFHMNWGWGGTFDGYFEMSDLHPAGYYFNDGQMAMINMIPLPTGTTELAEQTFEIFPNPASNVFKIRYQIPDAGCQMISLFAIGGKKIWEKGMTENEMEVDVSELPVGMYFVRVQAGGVSAMTKLLVVH